MFIFRYAPSLVLRLFFGAKPYRMSVKQTEKAHITEVIEPFADFLIASGYTEGTVNRYLRRDV